MNNFINLQRDEDDCKGGSIDVQSTFYKGKVIAPHPFIESDNNTISPIEKELRFEDWIVKKLAEKGFNGFDFFEERKEIIDRACENKKLFPSKQNIQEEDVWKEAWKNYFSHVSNCRLNGKSYLDMGTWFKQHYTLIKK